MLQKQFRLPATVRLTQAASYKTRSFLLKVAKNDLPYNRFGFVVRKSVDKRSTVRNKIKRLLRSCIEEMFAQIHTGYDMLFLLNGSILEMKREDLYNQVHEFLKTNKFLK